MIHQRDTHRSNSKATRRPGVPIYRQIMDQVRALIASGRLEAGDQVASVRQMAADLEVNIMTVSKAWAKLEAEGLLERGRGMLTKAVQVGGSGRPC